MNDKEKINLYNEFKDLIEKYVEDILKLSDSSEIIKVFHGMNCCMFSKIKEDFSKESMVILCLAYKHVSERHLILSSDFVETRFFLQGIVDEVIQQTEKNIVSLKEKLSKLSELENTYIFLLYKENLKSLL